MKCLDAVEDKHEHVLITRNGRPSVVMLSADEYESLEETLDILQDKDLMEALKKSEDDIRAGSMLIRIVRPGPRGVGSQSS